jgi:uncharacterized coiled-coil DUF342 family protein
MFELSGVTPLLIATAAFALLLIVLTTIAATTVIVNRHRPTIAEAVRAENRRDVAQIELENVEEKLREARAVLTEADKKAAEVAWLEERIASLNAQLAELEPRRQEINDLQSELERVLGELADAKRELDNVEADIAKADEAQRKLDLLEASIEAAEARKTDLEAKTADLEERKEELAEVTAQLRDARRRQVEAEDGRDAAKRQEEEIEARSRQLRQQIDTLQNEIEGLQEEIEPLRSELWQMKSDVVFSKSERAQVQEQVQALEADVARLNGEIGALKVKAEELRRGPASDPLADLRVAPKVVKDLMADAHQPQTTQDATEAAYLKRARDAIAAAGLYIHPRKVDAFHTALKVSPEAPMTVLAGISGTGKTQLPRRYAEGMGIGFLPMPVQPRWDSPQDLLGFYNFIEQRYKATELSRAMYQLDGQGEDPDLLKDRMLLVLLDEMNLARVEYYFSEFLSRLELRPSPNDTDIHSRQSSEIVIEVPGQDDARIFPGHNLLFAGTMNEDESTQSLSDKVLDRGNMLRFPAPPNLTDTIAAAPAAPPFAPISFQRWTRWRRTVDVMEGRSEAQSVVEELSGLMREMGRPFGHRVAQAILAYVANYPVPDGQTGSRNKFALADQIEMRLLPKLRGIELEEHGTRIRDLGDFAKDRLGDQALAEAIEISLDMSQGTDRFAWQGVAR